MVRIIVGTTPSIHYNFRVADPEDFTAAYLPARTTAATLTIPGSQKRRASDEAVAAAEARGWTIKAS